ncbi:MAG: large conductance mechanosensitive channel protein MscL [Rhizobiales bacterium]|nr:large conductance mechanosensitive channel protein MscL [Hyphomicrobiales bacterium]MBI3673058.1 large conductance mechanosensitive channel protein MscL [Hyphomicrobiales bacterium]
MWQEFKSFAFKGNAFDLAIGVIIAVAFGKIVSSIVDDLIMPIVAFITGGIDFSNKFIQLAGGAPKDASLAAAKEAGATIAYGNFFTVLIQFVIIAFILFQLVKISNRMKKAEAPAPAPGPTPTETLLTEIRDALKAK